MIALDTNVLVDILVTSQPHHPKAKAWLIAESSPLATTEISLGELLRLITHPRVFKIPMKLAEAIDLISDFLKEFQIAVLREKEEWWNDLKDPKTISIRGNEIFDARIAFCLKDHGIKEFCTFDNDFQKYPFLKIIRY